MDALADILDEYSDYASDAYHLVYSVIEPDADGSYDNLEDCAPMRYDAEDLYYELCHIVSSEYGPLAYTVLDIWGIHTAVDIGRIVFRLIDAGVVANTFDDCLEDYVYFPPLDEMLEERYIPLRPLEPLHL